MGLRIAVLGDIHGNITALDAALLDIATHHPDRLVITGDLVMNGPRPSETVRRVMDLERAGALYGTDLFGGRNWYNEGSAWLLTQQAANGGWSGVKDTCWAVLLLRRATKALTRVYTR